MIRINLVPVAQRPKETLELLSLVPYLGILVALIGLFMYLNKVIYLTRKNAELVSITRQIKDLQSVVNEVEGLKEKKASLQKKFDVINSLMENRLLYPKFMQSLVELTPGNMWISDITTKTVGDKLEVKMSASAFDTYTIANFVSALEGSQKREKIKNADVDLGFMDINLGNINQSGTAAGGKLKILTFAISYNFRTKKDTLDIEESTGTIKVVK
ncbi:MAG: hypothetical protein WC955_04725 [Elusimicrobiota bacterium]